MTRAIQTLPGCAEIVAYQHPVGGSTQTNAQLHEVPQGDPLKEKVTRRI